MQSYINDFAYFWVSIIIVIIVSMLDNVREAAERDDDEGIVAVPSSSSSPAPSSETRPVGYVWLDATSRSGKGRATSVAEARGKLKQRASEQLESTLSASDMKGVCSRLMTNIDYLRSCNVLVVGGSHEHLVTSFMRSALPWATSKQWIYVTRS